MAVDQVIREAMSAVMDGEASEMDLARVFKAIDVDPDARAHWQRLQVSTSLLKTGALPSAVDVSTGVRAALEAEKPQTRQLGPLASLAVAASVTLAVVFGGQFMLEGGATPAPTIAQVPGGVMALQGGMPVQARYSAAPQAQPSPRQVDVAGRSTTAKVYEQLARERFERYGVEHAQMTAALQPNGLVPFARVGVRSQ